MPRMRRLLPERSLKMNKYFNGLEHIGIFTPDIQKSEDFYINKLGFDLVSHEKIIKNGDTLYLHFLKAGTCVIELIELPDKSIAANRGAGLIDHFSIQVNDIDALVNELKQKGIEFETEEPAIVNIFEKGIKSIFFKGAFGERIEFCQSL